MSKSKSMAAEPAKMDKHKDGGHDDYEADSAVETLMRAHEIKSNKEMMARVKKKAGRKLAALSGLKSDITSIDDIKMARDSFGKKKKVDLFEDEEE